MSIIVPVIWCAIIYWMIKLNDHEVHYILFFFFISILLSFCGDSLGLLTGAAFSDPKVAISLLPLIVLPFLLFAGFFAN